MARYSVWERELAMDIVQDSMEKMIKHYSKKPGDQWPKLFYRILRNTIKDHLRVRKIRTIGHNLATIFSGIPKNSDSQDGFDLDQLPGDSTLSPERQVESVQLVNNIKTAVAKLPQRQRQVFMLREQMQYTIAECGEILGCSAGTIKQHHYRAIRQLQKTLVEYSHDK